MSQVCVKNDQWAQTSVKWDPDSKIFPFIEWLWNNILAIRYCFRTIDRLFFNCFSRLKGLQTIGLLFLNNTLLLIYCSKALHWMERSWNLVLRYTCLHPVVVLDLHLTDTLLRRGSRCQELSVRASSTADRAPKSCSSGASLVPASTRGSAEEST